MSLECDCWKGGLRREGPGIYSCLTCDAPVPTFSLLHWFDENPEAAELLLADANPCTPTSGAVFP